MGEASPNGAAIADGGMGDYAIVGLAAQGLCASDTITRLRLAFFGVGERATECRAAGEILTGPITTARLAQAQAALARDLQPHNDDQASSATRLHLARVLLARCIAELTGAPLAPERLSA